MKNIDHNKLSRTARVVITKNSEGVTVRLHYTYSASAGYGEAVVCFEKKAVNGKIKKSDWQEACRIANKMVFRYRIPLDINREEKEEGNVK